MQFVSSSKCSLFHKSNVFGSCIIHILYTECAKIKKNNSGAKRLILLVVLRLPLFVVDCVGFIQFSGKTPVISLNIIYGLAIIMNTNVFSVRYNLYLYI